MPKQSSKLLGYIFLRGYKKCPGNHLGYRGNKKNV